MFKERIAAFRQNRLSKRNKNVGGAKKAGCDLTDFDAPGRAAAFKSEFLRICRAALQRLSGKSCDDSLPCIDSFGIAMGYEDNKLKALADKRVGIICLLSLLLCLLIYVPAGIEADKGPTEISELERENEKRNVELHALFTYKDETLGKLAELSVQPEGKGAPEDESIEESGSFLEAYSDKLIRQLSGDNSGAALRLPAEQDGVLIKWMLPAPEAPSWLFGILILFAVFMWFSRYDSITKKKKADKAAFMNELPSLILQLTLLLNAGLTVEPAFGELVERNSDSGTVLSKCFIWLKRRAVESNSSFVREMYDFSKNFGDRDFSRFATLCLENMYHGSELSLKLEAERRRMWNKRLAGARASAKEAETGLCFPLMLLLLALVIICTMPAMSGM